jgi:hypothetical protein
MARYFFHIEGDKPYDDAPPLDAHAIHSLKSWNRLGRGGRPWSWPEGKTQTSSVQPVRLGEDLPESCFHVWSAVRPYSCLMLAPDRAVRLARFRALHGRYAAFSKEKSPEVRARKSLCEWLSPEQPTSLVAMVILM